MTTILWEQVQLRTRCSCFKMVRLKSDKKEFSLPMSGGSYPERRRFVDRGLKSPTGNRVFEEYFQGCDDDVPDFYEQDKREDDIERMDAFR